MKLYYTPSVCSLAVRIVLHELKLQCSYERVHLKSKQLNDGSDYLAVNPKGSVPALLLDNGELLTENVVILQYLADTSHATQLLPPVGDLKRYRTLEWLNFVGTDLHRYCSPLFWSSIPDDLKQNLYWPILRKKLSIVEQHFDQHRYLMGNEFTVADSYLVVILVWLVKLKADFNEWPNLQRYYVLMKARESVKQSFIEEELTDL